MATEEAPHSVLPGDKLGSLSDYIPGTGTYCEGGEIYSALWGCVNVGVNGDQKEISVFHKGLVNHDEERPRKMMVPKVNSRVTAKITNTNSRFCKADIIAVESQHLLQPFHGILRKEDVRATEKDSVDLYKSYRPSDIISARVIALGDAQSYSLSTAENELGVVHAVGEGHVPMVPVSWCQMQCPKTGKLEHRKVAKVKTAVGVQDTDT